MSDAGLTNGAFYPHFPSKAALVRETVAAALEDQAKRLHEVLASDGLDQVIGRYLSPSHRDNPADGCAAAALLAELARQPLATRRHCLEHILAAIRDIAAALPLHTSDRESVALALYATLIGALQLARAAKGTPLSDRALAAGAAAARAACRQQPVSRPRRPVSRSR